MTDETTDTHAPEPNFEPYEGLETVPDEAIVKIRQYADVLFSRKDYDRALDVFHELVRLRPRRADFWRDMGITARQLGRSHFGLFCLQRALRLDADDRLTQLNLGELLCRIGKPTEGLEVLEVVFEEGYDPSQTPEQQDDLTKRAGATLGAIRMMAAELGDELFAQGS